MNSFDNHAKRCEMLGRYLVEHGSTVRETAAHFDISKSTVHKDIREKLKKENYSLYISATSVLDRNKKERHLRGGMATKNKYLKLKDQLSKKK